jgi:hypothetical protein
MMPGRSPGGGKKDMPDVLDPQVVDEITTMNAKSLSDGFQTAVLLATQNAVANQQTVQSVVTANLQNGLALAQALTARATRFVFDISAEQAAAFDRQLGADMAGRLANIEASLAGGQQMAKIAQSTPPESAQALSVQLAQLSATIAGMQSLLEAAAARGGGGGG